MKATGIVRRIDDLGRVVIPKEIRRTMRIREGDPLEIYTSNEGEVIFKKYSPINELSENAVQAAEIIHKMLNVPTVIFDRDHVVAVAGTPKKEFNERRISTALEELLENRKSYLFDGDKSNAVEPVEGISKNALAIHPILSSGDITGAVALLTTDTVTVGNHQHAMLVQAVAMILGKQIED